MATAASSKAPPLAHVDGVEIFDAGTHRDVEYSNEHIDEMVANFEDLSSGDSPILRVPVVLGHSEEQDILTESGLPAAGWISRVYREGSKLIADFVDVPKKVASLINQRAYRKVSSEIYDEFENGGNNCGKTLRRVALLGAEIPEVKTLDDIPLATYSDKFGGRIIRLLHDLKPKVTPPIATKPSRRARANYPKTAAKFSEVKSMDRQSMLDYLASVGVDTATITDAIPDDVLASLVAACQGMQQKMSETPTPAPAAVTPAPAAAVTNPAPTPSASSAGGFPTTAPAKVTLQYTEDVRAGIKALVQEAVEEVKGQLGLVRKSVADAASDAKKARVHAFCERMVNEGKVLPAELDAGLEQHLLNHDADRLVKFGESESTMLDQAIKTIEARPVLVRFSERMSQGAASQTNQEADLKKVEAHYQKFSEDFRKVGTSKETYLKGFAAALKRGQTADQYVSRN